jgi:SAM-dependent methyltransferase
MNQPGDSDEYRLIADLYDHVPPYRSRGDVQFFVDAAREADGRVLELGCGTGRVLIPTARAGLKIVGLDLSPHMLELCRQRLRKEPPAVQARAELVEGDMRVFDLGRTFALATVPFRPFQHLATVDDQLACLACIRKHLQPGATLILDLFNPSLEALANQPTGEEHDDTPEFIVPDGRRVTRRARIVSQDRVNQVNHVELIYYVTHPDGREERLVHAFAMRYLFRFEVEHLLARSGFAIQHIHADYQKSALGSKYPGELIVVARKT